jgi:predicted metal-dependent enzyme (double-stranded beta helix superfamily)
VQHAHVRFDTEVLIADLLGALDEQSPQLAAKEVLLRALDNPGAVAEALGATFNPRTFGLLHHSDRVTVTHSVFPEGYRTGVHDHGMWAITGTCAGTEDNTFFRRRSDAVEPIGGRSIAPGEVSVLGSEAIHDVVAAGSSSLVAIHVYGGDLATAKRSSWDGRPLTERPFDSAAEFSRLNAALKDADLLADP